MECFKNTDGSVEQLGTRLGKLVDSYRLSYDIGMVHVDVEFDKCINVWDLLLRQHVINVDEVSDAVDDFPPGSHKLFLDNRANNHLGSILTMKDFSYINSHMR